MTEQIVDGGTSITKKIVKWRLNHFAETLENVDLLKQQKLTFEVTDSHGVTSKWLMSLDFKDDSTDRSTNGGSNSPQQFLWLVVGLVSISNNEPFLIGKVVPEFEGRNGLIIFKGLPSIGSKYYVGKANSWSIKSLRKHGDINVHLFTEGALMVKLEVTIINVLVQTPKEKDIDAGFVSEQKELSYQINASLENDETHSDVRIISKDGLVFFAHRWILSGASDVFEVLFRANMMEKGSGIVTLSDLSGDAVKILLHFIYTGKMAEEWKNPGTVEEVVYVADKYQIVKMKDYIDAKIGKLVTPENAGTLLELGDSMGLQRGASEIQKFIVENAKDRKALLEMFRNYSKGFPNNDNDVVTATVTDTDADSATTTNLPKATPARRGQKRKNF